MSDIQSAPAGQPARPVVSFRDVDIVFGGDPRAALEMIDAGHSRTDIAQACGSIVGVKKATLDVFEGEIVVLMGLSGSGKSTLLRAVNGLNTIARGSVTVFDGTEHVEVHRCSARRLRNLRRRRVAMVFQQFGLLPWRTVSDNVAFGLELDGVKSAKRRQQVNEQLDLVGLSGWGDKRVHELSGGMQQRVGLARAFATAAPILLMDEPFSALDPLIRVRLQDELLALQRKLNRTIIFVSHDLDEALKIGTRIAIMEGGQIVQVGTPQEIVLNPSSDYVRAFVAHMNPLNVLRAQEVMVPLERLPRDPSGGFAELDGGLTIGPSGHPRRRDVDVPIVPLEAVSGPSGDSLIAITRETPLRTLIDARLQHQGPFLVRDGDAVCGFVRDEDLFRCLHHAPDAPVSEPEPAALNSAPLNPSAVNPTALNPTG